MVAVAFNTVANDGLAGFGNALNDLGGPTVFNPNHDHCCHVGVAASADQRAKVQVQVRAKLQPPVRVRYGHAAFDVVRHGFSGGVRQIIERQNNDMVTHANAAVLAAVAQKCGVFINH